MPVLSLPRYAPLSNMVLAFDGSATIAQAPLPAALIPVGGSPGGSPFSLTFWMNAQPTLQTDASGDPIEPHRISGPVVVADIRGPNGPLVTWSLATDLTLSFSVGIVTPPDLGAGIGSHLSQWIFVASTYSPPGDSDPLGAVGLIISNGGQIISSTTAQLADTPNPFNEDRWLTVGNLPYARFPNQQMPDLGPFPGMIAQMRLWNAALGSGDVQAHMYDDPIGPKAVLPGPVIGAWRLNEGYGTTAFDYANPGPELLPVRYQPPPGNHMTLGTGDPATEPAWVVADVLTQVQKATSVQVSPPVPSAGSTVP